MLNSSSLHRALGAHYFLAALVATACSQSAKKEAADTNNGGSAGSSEAAGSGGSSPDEAGKGGSSVGGATDTGGTAGSANGGSSGSDVVTGGTGGSAEGGTSGTGVDTGGTAGSGEGGTSGSGVGGSTDSGGSAGGCGDGAGASAGAGGSSGSGDSGGSGGNPCGEGAQGGSAGNCDLPECEQPTFTLGGCLLSPDGVRPINSDDPETIVTEVSGTIVANDAQLDTNPCYAADNRTRAVPGGRATGAVYFTVAETPEKHWLIGLAAPGVSAGFLNVGDAVKVRTDVKWATGLTTQPTYGTLTLERAGQVRAVVSDDAGTAFGATWEAQRCFSAGDMCHVGYFDIGVTHAGAEANLGPGESQTLGDLVFTNAGSHRYYDAGACDIDANEVLAVTAIATDALR